MTAARSGDLPDPGERGPRYSARVFPTYRYVPGVQPHPVRDARGHSYVPLVTLNRHAPWKPEAWRELDDWLFGVDLFNWFYFWEAHEAWEGLWAACARDSDPALLLQGLIQIAAALLKTHMRHVAGAERLSRQGLEKLDRVGAAHRSLLGLSVAEVTGALRHYFAPLARHELPLIGSSVPRLWLAVPGREDRRRWGRS